MEVLHTDRTENRKVLENDVNSERFVVVYGELGFTQYRKQVYAINEQATVFVVLNAPRFLIQV